MFAIEVLVCADCGAAAVGALRGGHGPERYQSPQEAQALWMQPGGPDRVASLWIELGTATIAAGQATTLELRLPPEWEK